MPNATMVPAGLAPIEPGTMYPLPVFKATQGLGQSALTTAKRNGLLIRKIGNRKYVLGADWIEYVKTHGSTEAD